MDGSISPSCLCTIDLERYTAQRAPQSGAEGVVRLVGGRAFNCISSMVRFVLKKVAEPLHRPTTLHLIGKGLLANTRPPG